MNWLKSRLAPRCCPPERTSWDLCSSPPFSWIEQMQAVREFIICDQDNTDYIYFCMLRRGYVLYVWIYLSNRFGACWPARGVWQRRVRLEERMCVSILIVIYTPMWRRPPPVIMPMDTEKDVTAKCIPNSVIYNTVRAPKIQCPHDATRSYLPYKYLHEQIIEPLNKTKDCHLLCVMFHDCAARTSFLSWLRNTYRLPLTVAIRLLCWVILHSIQF